MFCSHRFLVEFLSDPYIPKEINSTNHSLIYLGEPLLTTYLIDTNKKTIVSLCGVS